jgi:hypothetical protein
MKQLLFNSNFKHQLHAGEGCEGHAEALSHSFYSRKRFLEAFKSSTQEWET